MIPLSTEFSISLFFCKLGPRGKLRRFKNRGEGSAKAEKKGRRRRLRQRDRKKLLQIQPSEGEKQKKKKKKKKKKKTPPPSPSPSFSTAMLATTPLPVAAGPGSGSALRSAVPMAPGAPSRRPSRRNAPLPTTTTKAAAAAFARSTTAAASRAPTARRRPLSSPPAAGYVGTEWLVSHADKEAREESVLGVETRSPLFHFLWRVGGHAFRRLFLSVLALLPPSLPPSLIFFFSIVCSLLMKKKKKKLQRLPLLQQHVHRRPRRPRRHGPEPGPQRRREGLPHLGVQQVRGQDRRVRLARRQGR